MTSRDWIARRVPALLLAVVLVIVTFAVPAWCVATGLWW